MCVACCKPPIEIYFYDGLTNPKRTPKTKFIPAFHDGFIFPNGNSQASTSVYQVALVVFPQMIGNGGLIADLRRHNAHVCFLCNARAHKFKSSCIVTCKQKVNIERYVFIQYRILKSCKISELIRVFDTPYMTTYGAWSTMQINTVLQVLNDVQHKDENNRSYSNWLPAICMLPYIFGFMDNIPVWNVIFKYRAQALTH